MFKPKYLPLPTNQDFQPIEIQLENYQQKKDIDFKLIVLLILIIMLGILIRKEEQRLQMQPIINDPIPYLRKQTDQTQLTQSNIDQKQVSYISTHVITNQIVNQQYQIPKPKIIINQQSQSNNPNFIHLTPSQPSSELNSQNQKQSFLDPRNRVVLTNYKSTHIIQRSTIVQTKIQYKPINNHSQILKKYIEFYLWFPFFIFALIVYSCYEKQSSQSSILISVKTLNQDSQVEEVGECAICINEISINDPLAVLPCSKKHIFHSKCIKEWLPQKKTCPICRSDVRKYRNIQK